MALVEERSSTAKDSRRVCRVAGGSDVSGSPDRGTVVDAVGFEDGGLAVDVVFVRAKAGRAVAVLFETAVMGEDSCAGSRATERDFVLEERGRLFASGDFARVGEEGGSGGAEVPRVVNHERSSDDGPEPAARRGDCVFDGESVEFLSGED